MPAWATANSVIASGEAIDRRVATFCRKQQENCGDQSSRVTDADPPDKIDDGKAPAHRLIDAPQSDAVENEVRNCQEQQLEQQERNRKANEPAHRRLALQDDGADFVGDRAESQLRPDHGMRPVNRCVLVASFFVHCVRFKSATEAQRHREHQRKTITAHIV
jgi:hypothetical protein